MRVKKGLPRRLVVSIAMVLALVGGTVAATGGPAMAAYPTVCKTLRTNSGLSFAIVPHMLIPVCYNGDRIWQNGHVSGGVNTFGYVLDGIDWTGTYNSGGSWLGAGINYRVSAWGEWWGFTCLTRWTFNAHGQQTSYNRGC